ncbi:MAG: hypothetical protein M0003_00780 [Acidithiobacillus sp.]|nr:hypothetical protein [Acidithiobacillus sp.]
MGDEYRIKWKGLLERFIAECPVERRALFTSVAESLDRLPADMGNVLVDSLAYRLGGRERARERGDGQSTYLSGLGEERNDRDAKSILRNAVPLEYTLATIEGRQVWERLKEKALSRKGAIVDSPHYSSLFVELVLSANSSIMRVKNPYLRRVEGTPKEAASRYKARTKDLERSISMLDELQETVGSDQPLVSRQLVHILNDEMQWLLTINGAIAAIRSNVESNLESHKKRLLYDNAIAAGMMSRKQNDNRQNYLRILLTKLSRDGFPITGHLEGEIYPIARVIAHDDDMEPHHVIQAAKNVRRFCHPVLAEHANVSISNASPQR